MDPPADLSPNSAAPDLSAYCRFRDALRSWFWRYYDHLGHLLIYNFCWCLPCLALGWLPFRVGLIGRHPRFLFQDYLSCWFIYIIENAVSIGWTYLTFKVFIQGDGVWADVLTGFRKYSLKAMGLAITSSLILGLGLYNMTFYVFLNGSHGFWNYLLLGVVLWVMLFWTSSMLYQWPILFFQNPPFLKILYRSGLLVLSNGLNSLAMLVLFAFCFFFFCWVPLLWLFLGPVFFFSLQSVVLEKQFLRYKITYGDKPIPPMLELLEREKQRGWRDFLRPWENR